MTKATEPEKDDITLTAPEGDGNRTYKPVRGRRRPILLFVPNPRERNFDRYVQIQHLHFVDVLKDGGEIQAVFRDTTIVMRGERLRPVADAIAGGMGSRFEAFHAEFHDEPEPPKEGNEPLPIIRYIEFCVTPPREPPKQTSKPNKVAPKLEPEARAKAGETT